MSRPFDTLGLLQQQLLKVANQTPGAPKESRQAFIIQMRDIMQNLSAEQTIAVINEVTDEGVLRFMIAAGVPGAARDAVIARRQMLSQGMK